MCDLMGGVDSVAHGNPEAALHPLVAALPFRVFGVFRG
jgi:hypothetical protein